MSERRKDFGCGIVCITIVASAVLVSALIIGTVKDWHNETLKNIRKQEQHTYSGWVKQTGNPKQLTFDEWRELKRANLLR